MNDSVDDSDHNGASPASGDSRELEDDQEEGKGEKECIEESK